MENCVDPDCGYVSPCVMEYGTTPPPEQVSQESHPDICSMLETVVPVGAGPGFGTGVGVGVGVGVGLGVGVGGGVGLTMGVASLFANAEATEPLHPESSRIAEASKETLLTTRTIRCINSSLSVGGTAICRIEGCLTRTDRASAVSQLADLP
jgi:hypothetical protein